MESEEQETRYCKYCSTKLVKESNLKYPLRICDKDDCFLKLDKELYPDKYSQSDSNYTRENKENKNIVKLQSQITNLENKPNKTKAEQALLEEKKKQLEELLNKKKNNSNTNTAKPSDKTGLYIGCGTIGLFVLLLVFILARNRQKRKK
ncbi:MAG: hypothetical protein C5B43_00930 [Verrucomicrobia bacterium]|nr:MAG: hypothetical protein C5B43_00930 [Verrucomicrobiota bacterium]